MAVKKVLIVYFPRPPIIDYLKKAFERKGIEAHGYYSDTNNWFDKYVIHYLNKYAHNLRILPKSKVLFKDHPLSHLQFRSQKLLEKVREVSPDIVFVVRGWRFTEDVLQEIRKTSKVFGWWIEKEERMEEPFREAHLFDHYFFMNSACTDEGAKRGIKNLSVLHHSVSAEDFYPMDTGKKYDWCFVGGWSPRRMLFIERALKISKNAVIYGPKWLKNNPLNFTLQKTVKGEYIGGAELVKLYNESKVVLNVTNWGFGEGDKRTGMNMRVLEVPACKACLLTDGSKDLTRVITPERHVVLYEGIDEFGEKLSSYIKDDAGREKVAEAGYRHVITNYTYDDIARILIDTYNSSENGKAKIPV